MLNHHLTEIQNKALSAVHLPCDHESRLTGIESLYRAVIEDFTRLKRQKLMAESREAFLCWNLQADSSSTSIKNEIFRLFLTQRRAVWAAQGPPLFNREKFQQTIWCFSNLSWYLDLMRIRPTGSYDLMMSSTTRRFTVMTENYRNCVFCYETVWAEWPPNSAEEAETELIKLKVT